MKRDLKVTTCFYTYLHVFLSIFAVAVPKGPTSQWPGWVMLVRRSTWPQKTQLRPHHCRMWWLDARRVWRHGRRSWPPICSQSLPCACQSIETGEKRHLNGLPRTLTFIHVFYQCYSYFDNFKLTQPTILSGNWIFTKLKLWVNGSNRLKLLSQVSCFI